MSTGPSLTCGDCFQAVTFDTIDDLKQHYLLRHNQLSSFTCGVCKSKLLNKTSLIRHIKQQHPYLRGEGTSFQENQDPSAQDTDAVPSQIQQPTATLSHAAQNPAFEDSAIQHHSSFDPPNAHSVPLCEPPPPVDLDKVAARIVLGLRSKASLTGKAIERFQEGCVELVKSYRETVIQELTAQLSGSGLSESKIDDILKCVKDVGDIFGKLKTIENQLSVFAEEFGLVKPQEKYIGFRLDKRLDPDTNSYVQTQVKESFQYVSIIDTLQAILSNEKSRNNIFMDLASDDGVLRSYVDGNHCKTHPFIMKHNNVINILQFYDELEVANALGSKTIIHKLGVFFFQILNGSAVHCSQLSSIHLLILAYAEDMKKLGAFERVLTPFISEMKKLSSDQGVEISVNGQPFVLRALLTAVTADTLAAHDLLGFLAPGDRHCCRSCMISREELRQDGNHVAEPRSKEMHNLQVQEVAVNQRLSTQYGVKRDCPLNILPYFHCVESSVFDAFHDLLEGVVPLVMKLVLRHFICARKLLRVDEFNLRVQSFQYGIPNAKNRPSPNFTTEMLQTRKKLKQSGSQMWCLMRALPFLLLDNICSMNAADEQHMELIFLLQDIMKIVFAFEISEEELNQLEVLITKHHDLFKTFFVDAPVELQPEGVEHPVCQETEADESEEEEAASVSTSNPKKLVINIINKMHHLKHYPEMIRKFGPAVRVWCAKFEGRLKIFRQHSAVCCNFRNVPKTMAQMFQLSNVLCDDDDRSVEFQKGQSVQVKDLDNYRTFFLNLGFRDTQKFVVTNSVTVDGEEYRPGFFVRLRSSHRHSPLFALISSIYVNESNKCVVLLVNPWKVDCICLKYNCYKVSPNSQCDVSLVDISTLANFKAIAPWFVTENDDVYLSLRTGLF